MMTYFLGQTIRKMFNLILKSKALVPAWQAVIFFLYLNWIFCGYSAPRSVISYNTTKSRSGWPNWYIGYEKTLMESSDCVLAEASVMSPLQLCTSIRTGQSILEKKSYSMMKKKHWWRDLATPAPGFGGDSILVGQRWFRFQNKI